MIYQCRQIKTKQKLYFCFNNKIYYPSTDSYSKNVPNSLSLSDKRFTYVINKYSNTFGPDNSLSFDYPYSPTIKMNKDFI